MTGKIACTVVTLFITTFLILIIITFFLHKSLQQNVERVNYNTVEVICTKGEINSGIIEWLLSETLRYGQFGVIVKVEKQTESDLYDTYYYRFDNKKSLQKNQQSSELQLPLGLKVGDRVGIYLEGKDKSMFERLLALSVLGWYGATPDCRFKSYKTGIVSRNGQDP